jgi:hypothetical protein
MRHLRSNFLAKQGTMSNRHNDYPTAGLGEVAPTEARCVHHKE